MRQYLLILSMLIFVNIDSNAQISAGGLPPYSPNTMVTGTTPTIVLPELDITVILQEDMERGDTALCIGQLIPVEINILEQARAIVFEDDKIIYNLKIISKNAKSIQLSFDKYKLPKNSKFYVYSPDHKHIAGAFTSRNNRDDLKFSTQPIFGDEIILEVIIPSRYIQQAEMKLNYVCHNYQDINNISSINSKRTDCFLDVHCDNYIQNQIRSIMQWTYYDIKKEKNMVCSCVLLNQDVVPNDLKYYVLTAEHCGDHAELSTAMFYFNYQKRVGWVG